MGRQVEILKAANPDAVICIGAYAACAAFLRDAVDLGLSVPVANLSFVGSESLLQLITRSRPDRDRYTDLLVNSQVVPSYEDVRIPAIQEYRRLMLRHNPDPPQDLLEQSYSALPQSFVSLEGFLDAKMMVKILDVLGENPDRANLESAVFQIQDYDLGIGELVSFGPDRRQGLQTVYYTIVDAGRFVPLDDWKRRFA